MPNTPTFGFPYESPPFATPSDEPGRTLHGGSTGTSEILAEKVEEELERVDEDLQDVIARVANLEAGTTMPGWTPILAGNNTGFEFDIDLTDSGRFSVGEFSLVRLHMRFDLSETGMVTCRINNDSANSYTTAMRAVDAANADSSGVDVLQHFAEVSQWRLGYGATVSTNNLECLFFHMNGNVNHAYQSTSARHSTSATTMAWTEAWGYLNSALSAAPSTLRLHARDLAGAGITFANAWWWVEGYRVPS